MKRFRLTQQAEIDLESLWEEIADSSVDSADRVLSRFYSVICRIAESPGIGHWRDDLADRHYRFCLVYSYFLVYRPDSTPLEIVRVVHATQDVQRMLDVQSSS